MIPFDYCMQKMCPNGRELEYTPEVTLSETAAVGTRTKLAFFISQWDTHVLLGSPILINWYGGYGDE